MYLFRQGTRNTREKSRHSILGKSYFALGRSRSASFRPNNHARSCDLPRWNLLARADGLKSMLLWNFQSKPSKLCCLFFRGQLECERREECKRLSMTLPEALEYIAHKLDSRNLCGIENFSDWTGGSLTPQNRHDPTSKSMGSFMCTLDTHRINHFHVRYCQFAFIVSLAFALTSAKQATQFRRFRSKISQKHTLEPIGSCQ
jgi:hypothetical protein